MRAASELAERSHSNGVQQTTGLYCGCGRYVGDRRILSGYALPAGVVWVRHYCRSCARWRWFDAANGRLSLEPGAPHA